MGQGNNDLKLDAGTLYINYGKENQKVLATVQEVNFVIRRKDTFLEKVEILAWKIKFNWLAFKLFYFRLKRMCKR